MNYSLPVIDYSGVRILNIDEYTAVPYILLNGHLKEANEIIVFCHDFFDSFFEYKMIFEGMAQKMPSRKILLFNIPGQAYSIFKNDYPYNNIYNIDVLDRIFFHL